MVPRPSQYCRVPCTCFSSSDNGASPALSSPAPGRALGTDVVSESCAGWAASDRSPAEHRAVCEPGRGLVCRAGSVATERPGAPRTGSILAARGSPRRRVCERRMTAPKCPSAEEDRTARWQRLWARPRGSCLQAGAGRRELRELCLSGAERPATALGHGQWAPPPWDQRRHTGPRGSPLGAIQALSCVSVEAQAFRSVCLRGPMAALTDAQVTCLSTVRLCGR